MPRNKRESWIFTVMMCFVMVFVMSVYNIALHTGEISMEVVKQAWLGLPIAYIVAICCDLFLVSGIAKGFAFKFLIKKGDSVLKTVICVSCCMVIPMVIIMSLYGALEASLSQGTWSSLGIIWLTNIPKNFVAALPLQLLIAGPLVRKVFRTLFPEGKVLA